MARQTVTLLVVVVITFTTVFTQCFQPDLSVDGTPITHRDITQIAILRKTAEVCRDTAATEGRDFHLEVKS